MNCHRIQSLGWTDRKVIGIGLKEPLLDKLGENMIEKPIIHAYCFLGSAFVDVAVVSPLRQSLNKAYRETESDANSL